MVQHMTIDEDNIDACLCLADGCNCEVEECDCICECEECDTIPQEFECACGGNCACGSPH